MISLIELAALFAIDHGGTKIAAAVARSPHL
jgi:hypothetical protein